MKTPRELIRQSLPLRDMTPEAADIHVEWCYALYVKDSRPGRTPIQRLHKVQAVIEMCRAWMEVGRGPEYPPLSSVPTEKEI